VGKNFSEKKRKKRKEKEKKEGPSFTVISETTQLLQAEDDYFVS
jgi:hypothetical protein